MARPADDALLVSDDHVVGEPEALDPEEDYDLGWRYRVTLRDLPPVLPGDILVGTGELPVGGRVIAAEPTGDDQRVTVEVVGLDELFEDLVIDETIDLSQAFLNVDDQILADYRVHQLEDGTIVFVPVPTRVGSPDGGAATEGTRALGPFQCTTDADFPLRLPDPPAYKITPWLSLVLAFDKNRGGLQRLAVNGSLEAKLEGALNVLSAFEGKIRCEVELATLTLPIGGPIAFVVGGQVPLGVGLDLEAKLVLAEPARRASPATARRTGPTALRPPTRRGWRQRPRPARLRADRGSRGRARSPRRTLPSRWRGRTAMS